MMDEKPILYLSDGDVAALELDVCSVRVAVQDAFQLYADEQLRSEPKTSIWIGPGHAFQSLAVVDTKRDFAALKWIGMVPPGGAAAVNINASILLSDARSGQLHCLMDARRATGLRTAGMSAVAAHYLARQDSVSIGFVGAGVQAESHLLAFAEVLPSLTTVRVNSRTQAGAERFAERSRNLGFTATAATVEETLAQSDVVVTTVPLAAGFEPFLDASLIRPGTFVAAVDLGRSWKHEGLAGFDTTVVDEAALRHYAKPGNLVPPLDNAQATLADLVRGRHRGRTKPQERIMLVSSGSAVGDLAIAMLIYERALTKGIGTQLAR